MLLLLLLLEADDDAYDFDRAAELQAAAEVECTGIGIADSPFTAPPESDTNMIAIVNDDMAFVDTFDVSQSEGSAGGVVGFRARLQSIVAGRPDGQSLGQYLGSLFAKLNDQGRQRPDGDG